MKTKSKRVSAVGRADDSALFEKALERTHTDRYRADEKSSKCIGDDNDREKTNYCTNNTNNNNHDNDNCGNDGDNNIVPLEIDIHFQMYGKHMWDVEYGEKCPLCIKEQMNMDFVPAEVVENRVDIFYQKLVIEKNNIGKK